VLVSQLAEFVSASMISFSVGYSCDGVGVRCQIVKLCGLIVRTLRHGCSPYLFDAIRQDMGDRNLIDGCTMGRHSTESGSN
jgi:hypothetical protein